VRAYAQGGPFEALFSLFIIAVIIAIAGGPKTWQQSPFSFALRIQAFLICYYLTQTSIRAVIVESASFIFGLLAIGSVWAADVVFKNAILNIREHRGQLSAESVT
jgi:hypothetical protein